MNASVFRTVLAWVALALVGYAAVLGWVWTQRDIQTVVRRDLSLLLGLMVASTLGIWLSRWPLRFRRE